MRYLNKYGELARDRMGDGNVVMLARTWNDEHWLGSVTLTTYTNSTIRRGFHFFSSVYSHVILFLDQSRRQLYGLTRLETSQAGQAL